MFYSQFILAKKGPLGTIWIAAHLERKLRKNQVADTDIGVSVDSIIFPEAPIALRLSSHLLVGVVRIYSRKVNYLFDDCSEALLKVKQAFRSAAVDLPPEESTAPYHSITLPETFDLDDFELPDNEIFQGNYVDHHVSTREQITLQDTMDGVVYSTSRFGLDERFGDGDTSQLGLNLDEEVFQDKDAVGSEDEGVPDTDHNDFLDAATPEIKDPIVEVSEALPRDLNAEKVGSLVMGNELMEDTQAPQTPGLVELPNLSGVRGEMTCDDHMDVEDQNTSDATEEGKKASWEHKVGEDSSIQYKADQTSDVNMLPDVTSDPLKQNEYHRESSVSPMAEDKIPIDGEVNVPNAERLEHIRFDSPCCSHITTEMEDPSQAMNQPGAIVDSALADKSDAFAETESPGGCTITNAENQGDAGNANQEKDHSLQDNGQADCGRLEEHLDNVDTTDKQLRTGFANSDFPPVEKVLSAPSGFEDKENGFMVESTPDKEDPGKSINVTRKRTFTESTVTAESLNSAESVGLIQSKRTANSVPDDDDLLSSILVGRPSFLRLKPTPVLEVASSKRLRSAPRSTASKRKVPMDDPMVLHGDAIRQQLTNTENIRRVRKKASCTRPEIMLLQRQSLEDKLLYEPIFTGMSIELVSLHNEPYDLRGIRVIEIEEHQASVEAVKDDECSDRPDISEVDRIEENSVPPAPQNDSGDDTFAQDHQIINPQGEMKDDHELAADTFDLEVEKEVNETTDEVNKEISEMPSGENIHCLDPVEDLRVEEPDEKCDEGPVGQDSCADPNDKSCADVIEVSEGDVENVILSEMGLKVEVEVLHDEKRTDASAEIHEIETNKIDSNENRCVEAAGSSNLALETCSEPLIGANNDGVNPEMESDNKDQICNEMFSDADLEPSASRNEDNLEMDTMEVVAHDTGFLNVDDDDNEEDNDDAESGDETRLLENTGWSSRTRAVAKYLQTLFDQETASETKVLVADKLLAGKTRKEASRMFFETLVLKTRDYIQVEQVNPYDCINIKPRAKLTKSIF